MKITSVKWISQQPRETVSETCKVFLTNCRWTTPPMKLENCFAATPSPRRERPDLLMRIGLLNRSADWQSAVSRIGNPQCSRRFMRPADCQSAIRQVGKLRYGRFCENLPLRCVRAGAWKIFQRGK